MHFCIDISKIIQSNVSLKFHVPLINEYILLFYSIIEKYMY